MEHACKLHGYDILYKQTTQMCHYSLMLCAIKGIVIVTILSNAFDMNQSFANCLYQRYSWFCVDIMPLSSKYTTLKYN